MDPDELFNLWGIWQWSYLVHQLQEDISPTSVPRSTMELPMENLLIGKGYANE